MDRRRRLKALGLERVVILDRGNVERAVPPGWTVEHDPAGHLTCKDPTDSCKLIDIGLPDADGDEVARQVRAALGDDVMLVAVTGYGEPEHRTRSRDAGFNDYIVKPVRASDLAAVFRRLEERGGRRRARGAGPATAGNELGGRFCRRRGRSAGGWPARCVEGGSRSVLGSSWIVSRAGSNQVDG